MESERDRNARRYHFIYQGDHKSVLPDDERPEIRSAYPGWVVFRGVADYLCDWQPSPVDTPQNLAVKLFRAGHPDLAEGEAAQFWQRTQRSWLRLAKALLPEPPGTC